MITLLSLLAILLIVAPAHAQIYSNQDPVTGVRTRIGIHVSPADTPRVTPRLTVLPQSIIDGEYKHVPRYRLSDTVSSAIVPHDPNWPYSAGTRIPERVVVEPQYFGSFIPLTPYGPLVNAAFIPPSHPPTPVPTPAPTTPAWLRHRMVPPQ